MFTRTILSLIAIVSITIINGLSYTPATTTAGSRVWTVICSEGDGQPKNAAFGGTLLMENDKDSTIPTKTAGQACCASLAIFIKCICIIC